MAGKTISVALALAAGLLAAALPASAHDDKLVVRQGEVATEAVSVSHNEGGSGVEVHRGPAKLLPLAPVAAAPVAYFGDKKVNPDRLAPIGDWFLDRSGDRTVLVHCYGLRSSYVGGSRRIRCSAREF